MTIIRTPLVGTILKNLPSATKIPLHVTAETLVSKTIKIDDIRSIESS